MQQAFQILKALMYPYMEVAGELWAFEWGGGWEGREEVEVEVEGEGVGWAALSLMEAAIARAIASSSP